MPAYAIATMADFVFDRSRIFFHSFFGGLFFPLAAFGVLFKMGKSLFARGSRGCSCLAR